MKQSTLDWTPKLLKLLLLGIGGIYVGCYLFVALSRIRYPFELEWMEGAILQHVRMVLAGHHIYAKPSLDFISYPYTPLYYYVSAAAVMVSKDCFLPLRLVSFVSSLGTFLLIFLMVRWETKDHFSSILSVCLFAATYKIGGDWFDIARPDSLFLFLLLAGFYVLRVKDSPRAYVLSGTLIWLSYLSKQLALPIVIPVMLYAFYRDRWKSLFFIGSVVGLTGFSIWFLDYVHEGWFTFYTFHLPYSIALKKEMIIGFWTKDILPHLPIACIASIFFLSDRLLNRSGRKDLFYPALAAGMLGGPWVNRWKYGTYYNVPIPSYAILSILLGLAIHRLVGNSNAVPLIKKRIWVSFIYLLCILQFVLLRYDPSVLIPTQDDLEAGRKMVQTISQIDGEVFIPYHGYLAVMAGKKSYAHAMAIADIIRIGDKKEDIAMIHELWRSFQERRFNAVILDSRGFLQSWLREKDYEGYCKEDMELFDSGSVFWPVTGARTRPRIIMRPCSKPDGDT